MAWVREVSPREVEETQGQRELLESPSVFGDQFLQVLQAFGGKGGDTGGRHISGIPGTKRHRQAVSSQGLLVFATPHPPKPQSPETDGEMTRPFPDDTD